MTFLGFLCLISALFVIFIGAMGRHVYVMLHEVIHVYMTFGLLLFLLCAQISPLALWAQGLSIFWSVVPESNCVTDGVFVCLFGCLLVSQLISWLVGWLVC